MRFFRSFRLLHRRTKSESDIISAFTNPSTYDDRLDSYYGTRGHQYTTSKAAAASGTLRYHPLDIEFLPFDPEELYAKSKCIQLPTPSDLLEAKMSVSNRTTENLHDDVADLHWRMAKMRKALNAEMADKQYHRCQAELRAEHIMELEAEVSRHEAIQSILGRVGLSKDVLERALAEDDAGRNGEQVIASAGIQCNRVEDSNSGRTSHPSDQYNAALNMTLIVRREMRGMRKIGKFWKRMAQNGGQNLETITPSPSNISSICEPLSAERKKAVDDLIAKRRLSHLVHKNTHSNRTSPISTSTSSTSTILAPKAFENLSPLASESIKFELGQISNKTKIFNRGSGSSKKDALPTLASDVGVKGSIETLNVDAQLQTPEKQEVVANFKPTQANPRYPSPNPDIMPAKVDKKRNSLVVSTRTFVSAVSASLRKSTVSKRTQTQRLKSIQMEAIHSRKNSDNVVYGSSFDNSAFCDVTRSSSLTSSWPTGPGQLPKIPSPFEHGASLGHISEESRSFRDEDSSFDTQATPSTAATTPSKTPVSKLPVLNYSRHSSPSTSPTPKKTYKNVTSSKFTRVRSTSSPTPKARSAIPVSIRQPGARKDSLASTSPIQTT